MPLWAFVLGKVRPRYPTMAGCVVTPVLTTLGFTVPCLRLARARLRERAGQRGWAESDLGSLPSLPLHSLSQHPPPGPSQFAGG